MLSKNLVFSDYVEYHIKYDNGYNIEYEIIGYYIVVYNRGGVLFTGSSWPCGQGGGLAVVRSPVRTLPPREYGGTLVVWPGMPFPNLDGRIHQSLVLLFTLISAHLNCFMDRESRDPCGGDRQVIQGLQQNVFNVVDQVRHIRQELYHWSKFFSRSRARN
jgi:hypothetical protein